MNKVVFIDKDGTLIKDVPYNVDPALFVFEPQAFEALRKWKQYGYKIIIVTNQSGVARGFFTEQQVIDLLDALVLQLAQAQIYIDGYYYCPHHPEGNVASYAIACDCRKPAAGMLLQAAKDHHIAFENSWMVGDILNDVEAGARAGCRTILIDNGNETEWQTGANRVPTYRVKNLIEAADVSCE